MVLMALAVSLLFLLTILMIFVNQKVIKKRWLRFLNVPYYWAPVIASIIILLIGGLSLSGAYEAIIGASPDQGFSFLSGSGPFSIVILFLSMTFVALTLDVSGFFEYLAVKVLKRVGGSGTKLFICIYLFTGILTVFTSNDILILTLTPFLIVFLRHIEINPIPFLIAEFFAANIFSISLLIGNPTNIIVATQYNLNFIDYMKVMFFPTLIAGITAFLVLYFIFKKEINVKYKVKKLPDLRLRSWEILGIILLSGTLLSLGILSMYGYLLWHVSLFWALVAVLFFALPHLTIILRTKTSFRESYIYKIYKKMPWEIIPFVLGFFIIIEAFYANGITQALTEYFVSVFDGNIFSSVFSVGILSTLSANLMNNIPMTVFFSGLLQGFAAGTAQLGALYALIVGSNFGAILTPIGALAGIMWLKMLKHEKINLSFRQFMIYGAKVVLVTLLVTLLCIFIIFAFF